MHYWLVMPAAGAGRRFGGPKQHAALAGRTVLELALQPFLHDPHCGGGVLVLSAQDLQRQSLRELLPPRFRCVAGGAERVHSVLNGLRSLKGIADEGDWVMVHDAARPCLSAADLEQLRLAAQDEPVGALLAAPVADTVKQVNFTGAAALPRALATVPREGLWAAQTPQMFPLAQLVAALEAALAAGRVPTDEAQAFEWLGLAPRLVGAQDCNLKVTSAADLALAAAVLQSRGT